jgi:hypothetical protein
VDPSPETMPERGWWVGQVATCPVCGAVVEIEADDYVRKLTRLSEDTPMAVYLECPSGHPSAGPSIVLHRPDVSVH